MSKTGRMVSHCQMGVMTKIWITVYFNRVVTTQECCCCNMSLASWACPELGTALPQLFVSVFVVVAVVDLVVAVVVIIVGHLNLTLEFGENQVNNSWDIVVVVVFVLFCCCCYLCCCCCWSRSIALKFGPNQVSDIWDIVVNVFVCCCWWGWCFLFLLILETYL